jgi:hypothetical protein
MSKFRSLAEAVKKTQKKQKPDPKKEGDAEEAEIDAEIEGEKEEKRQVSQDPKKFVIINPPLAGDENRMNEARSQTQVDYLIRLGLGDQDRLNFYRQAIMDPKKANQVPYLRQYVAEVLDLTMDIIFKDPQMYNRVRTKLQADIPQGGVRAGMKKIEDALLAKAERSGIKFDTLMEVYNRGVDDGGDSQTGFNRVNSFIAGGKARKMDADLFEEQPKPNFKIIKKALKGGSND